MWKETEPCIFCLLTDIYVFARVANRNRILRRFAMIGIWHPKVGKLRGAEIGSSKVFRHFKQLRRNSKWLGNYYTHSLHASKRKAVHAFALLKCTHYSLSRLFNNWIAKIKLSVGSLTQKYMLSTNISLTASVVVKKGHFASDMNG